MSNRLFLASQSPRRRELLRAARHAISTCSMSTCPKLREPRRAAAGLRQPGRAREGAAPACCRWSRCRGGRARRGYRSRARRRRVRQAARRGRCGGDAAPAVGARAPRAVGGVVLSARRARSTRSAYRSVEFARAVRGGDRAYVATGEAVRQGRRLRDPGPRRGVHPHISPAAIPGVMGLPLHETAALLRPIRHGRGELARGMTALRRRLANGG